MKEKIIKFFKEDRTYDEGVKLYHTYGNRMSFIRQLNGQPENEHIKGILFDELRQLAGLNIKEFQIIMSNPVKVISVSEKKQPISPMNQVAKMFEAAKSNYEKGFYMEVRDLLDTAKKISVENDLALPDEYVEFVDKFNYWNEPNKVSTEVKKAIKLREEFPFLKNNDCPEELKVLVSDMLTAYYKYKESHEELFKAENEDMLLEASKSVVENVIENQSIWDELNYYKENGEILGKHPIFKKTDMKKKLAEMSINELHAEKLNLEKSIAKYSKILKEKSKPDLKANHTALVAEKKTRLELVKKALGLDK